MITPPSDSPPPPVPLISPEDYAAHVLRVEADNRRTRAWWAWLDQLRRRIEQIIHKGEGWVIPEDEGMVECCVELTLDGQEVTDVAAALVTYFGIAADDAAALRRALTAAQREHLTDPQAQEERRVTRR